MADIKKLLMDPKRLPEIEKMANDIFNEIDLDGSGDIDRDEMGEILTKMAESLGKPKPTQEEIDAEIDKYDEDKDGSIDKGEFTKVVI